MSNRWCVEYQGRHDLHVCFFEDQDAAVLYASERASARIYRIPDNEGDTCNDDTNPTSHTRDGSQPSSTATTRPNGSRDKTQHR